ncbi:MAG: TetR/AcrR family transcriptional regulator C-terminal ligand-binding domain-containing protein [Myxococcota bacterium]
MARNEDDILEATLVELEHSGYEGLKVEAIADRAGVATTTIYRNWPERSGLVAQAVHMCVDAWVRRPDTGGLKGDLLEVVRGFAAFTASVHGGAVMRLFASNHGDPELAGLLEGMRDEYHGVAAGCVARARERGELMREVDPAYVAELISSVAFGRALVMHKEMDDVYIEWLVDSMLLMLGWVPLSPKPEQTRGDLGDFVPWEERELGEAHDALIDSFGRYYSARGHPKAFGKLLGLLVVANAPVAPEAASNALSLSRGSISVTFSALKKEGLGAVAKRPRDRVSYMVLPEHLCASILRARASEWRDLEGLVRALPTSIMRDQQLLTQLASVSSRAAMTLEEQAQAQE